MGTEFVVLLRAEGLHKLVFADDFIHIHSLMKYKDLIGHNTVGDTKSSLLRCFPIIFTLKSGYIITTGQWTIRELAGIWKRTC